MQNITWKKENRWTIFYQWGVHHSNVLYLGCNLVILNSRPITTFSEADLIGLQPSTTGYFLTSRPFPSLIELACICYKESETHLQIWILVDGSVQCIWLSWRCKIIAGGLLFSLSPWPILLLWEVIRGWVDNECGWKIKPQKILTVEDLVDWWYHLQRLPFAGLKAGRIALGTVFLGKDGQTLQKS